MKVCPTCDQTFNDDNLMFCLLDGARLEPAEGQPTVVIPKVVTQSTVTSGYPPGAFTPPPQKSKTPLIVGLTVVVMLIGILAVAGILYLFLSNRGDTSNSNKPINVNVTVNKPSPTPKASPSASATPVASPTVAGTKPTPANDDSDEVTPIAWNTSAATFKTDVGRTYKFECPAGGTESAVWGSDIYTADSSVCTAAVHAGVITLESGGTVTIEFRPGRAVYGSTVRNGITSNTYGEYPHSFVVR